MNKRLLLKSQKNEVLEILNDHGLNPQDFRWSEVPSNLDPEKTVSRLVRLHTDFFYSFEMQGEAHFAIFSPANQSYIGTDYPGTWDEQCRCFSKWLQVLIKETNEPDLWSQPQNHESHKNTPKTQTYVAEPTSQSPSPQQFASQLDHLLELTQKRTEAGFRPKISTVPIKRYYGKA